MEKEGLLSGTVEKVEFGIRNDEISTGKTEFTISRTEQDASTHVQSVAPAERRTSLNRDISRGTVSRLAAALEELAARNTEEQSVLSATQRSKGKTGESEHCIP